MHANAKANPFSTAEGAPNVLANSELFAGLENAAISEIAGVAKTKRFPAKTNVVTKGTRPDYLLLLRQGRARSYTTSEDGSEIALLWVVPGMVLGLVSLLPDPPTYMVNATTVSECEFLAWDLNTVHRLVKQYPRLAENGFRLALKYLRVYIKRHTNIVTKTAEARLADTLVGLARSAGVVRPSGIKIDITNEQLSSLSDIGLFTASRLLSRWEQGGRLSKHRGGVTLLDPQSLSLAKISGGDVRK